MKPKDKSHSEVLDQLTRMQMEYGGNCHMKRAYKIAEFFCNNITTQFKIERKSMDVHEKCSYAVR